jgi:1-acyl-sn-glycerol-3-phosphate acyltransferase
VADRWERNYRGTVAFGSPFIRLGFRLEGGYPDLPDGRLVVAANHFSFIDPVMVGYAIRRPMRYLAVQGVFDHSTFLANLITQFGAVPLRNEGVPLQAMRLARDHLLDDGTVGIFPEGKRVAEWGDERAKLGAAWLALKTGSPVLPVFIHGSDATLSLRHPQFRFVPVGVRFGEVIEPSFPADRAGMWQLSEAWEHQMHGLAAHNPIEGKGLRFGKSQRVL